MEILILSLLILLNGLFALSEMALVSSKQSRLEQLKANGSKGAHTALKLLANSENFLSAIQVGITLIGIVTGVFGGMNLADDITPFFEMFEWTQNYAGQIALSLTVVVITYFSIVIGELVPKTIAITNPERIAVVVAPFVYYFSTLFYPFVKLLSISTTFVNNLIGITKRNEKITEFELKQMLKIASAEGVIEKEQNLIHEKVFYFSDKKAKHIMTHRTDIEWIDTDAPLDKIKTMLIESQHSKVVCAHKTIDDFRGVIYLKDFYKQLSLNNKFNLDTLIHDPLVVPKNLAAQKVLDLFRQHKIHICFVVNEYGSFEGMITLHDIMESIVGQIPDEDETYEADVFVRDDNSVLVSGDSPIETLSEIIPGFHADFDTINYSTVAGFVFQQLDKIPQTGDKFEYLGHTIEIMDTDGNKTDKILITKTNQHP